MKANDFEFSKLVCKFVEVQEIHTLSLVFPKLYGLREVLKMIDSSPDIMYHHTNGLLTGNQLTQLCENANITADLKDEEHPALSKYKLVYTTKDEVLHYISENYSIIK